MILDRLDNLSLYRSLLPHLDAALDFLKLHDLSAMEPKRYDILPDGAAFVNLSDSPLKPSPEAVIEFHRRYIDIQIPFSGPDRMGWMPLAEAPAGMEYDRERDCALLRFQPPREVTVNPGEFIVFFPQDVHAPCLGTGMVRKAIVKLEI